jgi:3D (Asp-Asp-Asp) domain-containing protein
MKLVDRSLKTSRFGSTAIASTSFAPRLDTVADVLERCKASPAAAATKSRRPSLREHPLPSDVIHIAQSVLDRTRPHHDRRRPYRERERRTLQPERRARSIREPPGIARNDDAFVRSRSARAGSHGARFAHHSRAAPRVVARGIAEYSSLAHVAERGFTSALHFAGSALHMIATAYTAGCYGCSGITATGVRAGFGVIAVDPHGHSARHEALHPGYGRAVAGDTGGAIVGHRVDLGMNTLSPRACASDAAPSPSTSYDRFRPSALRIRARCLAARGLRPKKRSDSTF